MDDGRRVAIDCGPDFRQQMLREGVDDLEAIVFTHEHRDHTAGLDDIRAINFKRKKPVAVYATERVQAALRRQFDYIFAPSNYPGLPQITLHPIREDEAFSVCGLTWTPIPLLHYKMPVLGFRLDKLAYITDANQILPEGMAQLHGLDTLVINALRQTEHISHFSLAEALAIVDKLEPNNAVLTHISHQMGLHQSVDEGLPNGIRLGYDGLALYF
jgi:phosphoribosyl 1,2-cyclic phosphate phosphodiesterase